MKFVIVFVALFGLALAAPSAPSNAEVQILRLENEANPAGDAYSYGFETSDGTSKTEQGQLKNAGTENEAISVQGSYSFIGIDGITYTVKYIADENGFQPEGAHLPVAPVA